MFAELPKFTLEEKGLATVLVKWFFFLKHAGGLSAVPAVLGSEPAIAQALDIANEAALTPEELLDQERRAMFIQDQRGAFELVEKRALEAGRQQGVQQGIQQGEEQERLRIARELVGVLDDDSIIAEKTGLPVAKVRALRIRRRKRSGGGDEQARISAHGPATLSRAVPAPSVIGPPPARSLELMVQQFPIRFPACSLIPTELPMDYMRSNQRVRLPLARSVRNWTKDTSWGVPKFRRA